MAHRTRIDAVRKAVRILDGQKPAAAALDVSPGLVWQWLNEKTEVTAERAVDIERATDRQVRRHEIRPDLFDPPADSETVAA